MKKARGVGVGDRLYGGRADGADPEKRSVQRPRVFYRRELESNPIDRKALDDP